jgi:predicted dehydrogenase
VTAPGFTASAPRAGIIGTGFIGGVHLRALRQLGIQVVAVAGSNSERAHDAAASWNISHAHATAEALINDPDVNVVHITSPNHLHFVHASAALKAGKHVICEKPLAMTSVETAELTELAQASGLVAAVNFNLRFYPHSLEMRSRVRTGVAGQTFLVTGSYLQDWLLKPTDWNWRVDAARGGELRVVGDIGSHWFDLAEFVTGSPIEELVADLATFVPVRKRPVGEVATFAAADSRETTDYRVGSEDAASILVRFRNGARGAVTVSQVSAGRKNAVSMQVNSSKESMSWHGERPDELWIGHRDTPNELMLSDPALLSPDAAAIATLPGGHAEGFRGTFVALYAAVYADIARGSISPDATYAQFRDGHREALLTEATSESARTGRWVSVDK